MNNKYSYIGITFIVLIFGIYVVRNLDNRITNDIILDNNRLNKKNVVVSNKSDLFTYSEVPSFEFKNQYGQTIDNKSFEGKVYVVEFFFTTCPSICPLMTQKMLDIQNEFLDNTNVGMASISITPETDTPAVLKEYADLNGITHKNWHLLTGKSTEIVFDLSNKGFKLYTGLDQDSNHGGFEHSGLFALIDKNGNIRSRIDEQGNPILYYRALEENGFPDQIKELKEDIKILLDES